ncbi:MAG: TonB-dependent receptor [Gammaproteobacteria bacterium]|nr:TonB-dependent receptor [Gammaproteobacteria bacterium]MYK82754.1 TonB-dependent receptor [Gammaproteobacteria bacterium]
MNLPCSLSFASRRTTGALAAILTALLPWAGPSAAVAEEAQAGVLEEIIVTGTKREASQQDTPIAISTITANDIAKTYGNDIRAVGDLSPNVNLTLQTGFNALAGGIRGTGTISILTTQDPSVGLLIDEFALNHVQTQFVELFDLEQVEIYRGPQGTLFGKNSTGGTIAITSKRPDLDNYGSTVRLSTGGYDGGSDNYKAQVAVDVPLIQGQLGFRFAGSYVSEQGFYTNDKDTATFPNSPLYGVLGLTPDLLPPELSLVTSGAGERISGKDVLAAKSKLLWQPNDQYEAYFIWEIVRDDSDSPANINETPAGEGFLFELLGFPGIHAAGHKNPFSTGVTQQGNGINIPDGHRVDVDGYYLTQTLSFDQFSIKSITGLREQEETLPSSYTGEAFLSLFDATRNLEREQLQQEVRLISELDGPLNFVVGGIYISDELDFRAYSTVGLSSLFPTGLNPAFPFFDERGYVNMDLRGITNNPNHGIVKQDRKSWAAYADGTFVINDQFSVTAGVRYTKDKKDFYKPTGGGGPCNQYTELRDAQPADPSKPLDLATNCIDALSATVSRAGLEGSQIDQRRQVLPDSAYRFIADSTEKWSEATWRVVLDYKPNNDQLWYASVATGFLAGGFSETCSQEPTCIAYDPEKNINYEVGFKADLLESRLRFNVAAFYTDFEDLQRNQVFRFTDPVSGVEGQETITLNAGESNAKGVEIETTWLVTENLQVKGSLGFLDASYDVFEFEGLDLTDLDIPFASKWQVGGQITYDHPLGNGGHMTFAASVHYQSDAEMSPFDPNAATGTNPKFAGNVARHPTYTQLEERTLIDAAITYNSPDERWFASLFGKNLLNEEYRVSANSVGGLWNFSQYGAPLQWGVELGFLFGN